MRPFTDRADRSIASLGESALISRLSKLLGDTSPPSPQGIGDDCAVIGFPVGSRQLITIDPIIRGTHFDDTITPEQAAAKLVNRNASDIASMGGIPSQAVLSLIVCKRLSLDWIDRFYLALSESARSLSISIVGGDVSESEGQLSASLALCGYMPSGIPALQRGLAESGSSVFVTGSLGGSRVSKHWAFEPRLREGQWLASSKWASACMDLSDGLGKDGAHMPNAENRLVIDSQSLPISDDAFAVAERDGKSPLWHALNDGEDYELLFATHPEADLAEFEALWKKQFATPLTRIGKIEPIDRDDGARIAFRNSDRSIDIGGYEHLR